MKYLPMLLATARSLPRGSDWSYEPKLDGYRVLTEHGPDRTRLYSRHGTDLTAEFPLVARAVARAWPAGPAVLDGEIVALDRSGQPSLPQLQRRQGPFVLFVFDVLESGGQRVVARPLRERRELLEATLVPGDSLKLVEAFDDGDALWETVLSLNLEGLVAKRLDSPYLPGRRSRNWQKLKP